MSRTSTAAATSATNESVTDDSEYSRDKFWEVIFALIGAGIGFLHALSANEGHIGSWHAAAQIGTEVLIFAVLGFLVKQADYLRDNFKIFQAENRIDRERIISTEVDTKKELARLCNRAEKSFEIKEGIYELIGNVFSHKDAMVRRFLMGSLGESLSPLRIGPGLLIAGSDIFTRSLYSNFWDELLDEQIRRGPNDPLQVYLSHASSIDVFEERGRETDLLLRQGDFVSKGGSIRRVLIRPNEERIERYEAVKRRMEQRGMGVKIIDLDDAAARADETRLDFLLVRIDERPYVLQWDWNYSRTEGKFGRVSSTNIHLTDAGCKPFYEVWRNILNAAQEEDSDLDHAGWQL